MKTLLIYHADLDGIASSISYAKNYLFSKNKNQDITINIIFSNFDFLNIQYGDNLYSILEKRNLNLENYNSIVLLDFSLDLEVMKELYNQFKENFIWIDHHKLIDNEIEKILPNIIGIRSDKNSACVLVSKFFKLDNISLFCLYVEDQDLWKFEISDSRYFNQGMNYSKEQFSIEELFKLLDNNYFYNQKDKYIERGKVISLVDEVMINKSKRFGDFVKFKDYNCFIVNTDYKASTISNGLFSLESFKDIDIIIVWNYLAKEEYCKVSLRSNFPIDVSVIAKDYGGGGHREAAGFTIKDIKDLKLEKLDYSFT